MSFRSTARVWLVALLAFACSGPLSEQDVFTIVTQAVEEADANGVAATIAVTDVRGNVLAVFEMSGAASSVTLTSGKPPTGPVGLDRVAVGAGAITVSKAATATYLSATDSSFSSRSLGELSQEHFPAGLIAQPSGMFYGLKLSQLACGGIARADTSRAGPRALPLGFTTEPGGVPLYREGLLLGGVGVEVDGLARTTLPNLFSEVENLEERIAVAAAAGFAPTESSITIVGRVLGFLRDTRTLTPGLAMPAERLPDATRGSLVSVPGAFAAAAGVRPGIARFAAGSGVSLVDYGNRGVTAEVLVTPDGGPYPFANPRAAITPSAASGGLSEAEVESLVTDALRQAERTRALLHAQPSRPARIGVAVVDGAGNLLGAARSPGAALYAADHSVQLARTAALFSAGPEGPVPTPAETLTTELGSATLELVSGADYVSAIRALFGDPTLLANGIAFSTRALGALSRPLLPDGFDGNPSGPLGVPVARSSTANTGLQSDLLLDHLLAGATGAPTGSCRALQTTPGGLPIYRDGRVIGGIGVSGDGGSIVDLIAFVTLDRANLNAPPSLRADQLAVNLPNGSRVVPPYVQCQAQPFLDSGELFPCEGR